MNSILISIRPPFSGWLLNGKKTTEIRKTRPMFNPFTERPAEGPVRVYIYETRTEGGAGAIVGRFDCPEFLSIRGPVTEDEAADACLTVQEMERYRGDGALYAWRVVNPKTYQKPVPLAAIGAGTRRPPQSWHWLATKEAEALKGREKGNVFDDRL